MVVVVNFLAIYIKFPHFPPIKAIGNFVIRFIYLKIHAPDMLAPEMEETFKLYVYMEMP